MKFIKQISKPPSVINLLLGGMSSYDHHRGTERLHASDLTKADPKFCPREYAILDSLGKQKKGMSISASLRHTFDMGRDIEARVQNDYLRDQAVGRWTCNSCGMKRGFGKRPKNGCDREEIKCDWRYTEVRLQLDSMTCGLDLLVDVGRPTLRLVELKTVVKEDFLKLVAPLVEHRIRTILYLHFLKDSEYKDIVNTEQATVLYIAKSYGNYDKETGIMSPFREYPVQYDKEQIAPLLAQAEQFHVYKTQGKYPTGVCPTAACPRAKKCGVVSECFSGKFKSTSGGSE